MAQIVQIDVLIVAQLLLAGVADQRQLVLVGSGDALHQCGKGVAAAVGRICVFLVAVDVKSWIRQFQRVQQIVKHLAVGFEIQRFAVGGTEHLPGGPLPYPLIDDALDLGRDGDGAALARIRFCTAGKAALRAVIA